MRCNQAWSRFAIASQPLARLALAQSTQTSYAIRCLTRTKAVGILNATKATLPSTPINFCRFAHNIPRPKPAEIPAIAQTSSSDSASATSASESGLAPHYELTFTCKPCGTRSSHKVTKQGYHQGSVLIACPECRNRHIISDHLGIFGDLTKNADGSKGRTIEDIMREQGKLVKKGTLGENGDIEFWEDGTTTDRQTRLAAEDVMLPRSNKKPSADENGNQTTPGSTFKSAGKA
ncbi:hypothetical protein SEPCBS57363_004546 [Sporothrix epigloea]|uniref:DNL-type domain-containing protein n=1 Tax=Sporothrix epigloea TaxID=1892477 RepID=A0ABP0DWH9_9PEZI